MKEALSSKEVALKNETLQVLNVKRMKGGQDSEEQQQTEGRMNVDHVVARNTT